MSDSSHPPADRPKWEVLVVDDVVELRQLVQLWLESMGHRVTGVSSGRDAARLLRTRAFHLIVTDVIMPDGDGLEVLEAVRQQVPRPRVLAMSGGGQHLVASDCLTLALRLGANAVLRKPFDRGKLLEGVEQAMATTDRAAE